MRPAKRSLPLPLAVLALALLAGPLAGPAGALDKRLAEDVVVPPGTTVEEAKTGWGDVTVLGRVEDDVSSGFGNVRVLGPVGGDVEAGAGDVLVDGYVGGDVSVGSGNVSLGRSARVKGDVHMGNGTFEHHPEAEFGGLHSARMGGGGSGDRSPVESFTGLLGSALLAALLAPAAVLLAVVAPRPLKASVAQLGAAPGRSLLLGLASLPAVIVLLVALALTGVGVLLIPLLLPAYLAVVLFGALVAAYALGRKVLLATGRHRAGDAVAAAVGALLVAAVSLVPFLGGVFLGLLFLSGSGAALLAFLAHRRDYPRRPTHDASHEEYLETRRK